MGWTIEPASFKSFPWLTSVEHEETYQVELYFFDKPACMPINRSHAYLEINGIKERIELDHGASGALFLKSFPAWKILIREWFADEKDTEKSRLTAFYAYILPK